MNELKESASKFEGVKRIDYKSSVDGFADWALVNPPKNSDTWIICIHGHGSHGDQLYTRKDIREQWLPLFLSKGYGILTPNLRDNAWMSKSAASDVSDLLNYLRDAYNARRFIFASGSMGGTSNLIYASINPSDVTAVIALGAVSDLASYHKWCREKNEGVVIEIADAIETAYGDPAITPKAYTDHSVQLNYKKLTMPTFVAHGSNDQIIPVEQSRSLAALMKNNPNFKYEEIPSGEHDTPLTMKAEALTWINTKL